MADKSIVAFSEVSFFSIWQRKLEFGHKLSAFRPIKSTGVYTTDILPIFYLNQNRLQDEKNEATTGFK